MLGNELENEGPKMIYGGKASRQNVGSTERIASMLAGGALAWYGLRRRDRAGTLLALAGAALTLRGIQGHSYLYERIGVHGFAGAGGRRNALRGPAVRVEHAVTILRPIDEVYRFWRRFENLPQFMQHVVAVEPRGGGVYRWVARAPVGTVDWLAEVIDEQVPWLIAWRSIPGSRIQNAGSVHFSPAPLGHGTEVHVTLAYRPPAGPLGAIVARMLGEEPQVQVREDLERFKQIMEAAALPARSGE